MKNSTWILVILLVLGTLAACNSADKDSVRDDARSSLREIPPGTVAPPASSTPAAVSTSGVHHYICPNNCEGSGGASAGTCPVCGSEYTHNQAYHNQPSAANSPSTSVLPAPGQSIQTTPEPAQNAAGVWHYTCPAGCDGGAGSAGKCSKCGGDLAHNTAYHN